MSTSSPTQRRRGFMRYRFSPEIIAQVKPLNQSDNWHSLLFFAIDVFWIAICVAACLLVSWWLYPLAVLIIGARQRAFSTIFHDCIHGVGATNKHLEMFLGTVLTAYPIFQSYTAYKASHLYNHHPALGDPDRDPDLQYFIQEDIYASVSPRRCFNRIVILPIFGSRTISFLRYLFTTRFAVQSWRREGSGVQPRPDLISPRQRALDKAGFWLFWAAVALVGWWTDTLLEILLFWIVPYLTSFQLLSWYIELSEHTPVVREHTLDLYMTRNRKSRGLEKFLMGIHNDNYHLDHHLDPRTPCWNLAKAHAIRMKDEKFAEIDRATGGLITKGPKGQPSVISEIVSTLSIREEPQGGNAESA
jgi:fatty acid desaturase